MRKKEMAAIEARELTKTFGSIVAVEKVSFRVEKGEVFGLLGPNGAGKTTTIRMLTGILKPDQGEALIMGYNISKEPVKARSLIGVVPEEANPYPDLSTYDNLKLVGQLYSLPKTVIDERVSYLLKLLELQEARNREAKYLSKGMKQKLLIAMALISNPDVLFLDEPTSGLDVLSARKIRNLIEELRKEGTTILLTTHNVEEAGMLCNRVAIIKQHIVAIGSPDELKIKSNASNYLTITFDKPLESDASKILEQYDHKVLGNKLLLICKDPNDIIVQLVEYAKAKDLKIVEINTSKPSLEDVFVRLVGGE
jgi:ABC-2 type transport system ATP-binding protein